MAKVKIVASFQKLKVQVLNSEFNTDLLFLWPNLNTKKKEMMKFGL